MTAFAWSSLLAGIFSLPLGLIVFFKSDNRRVARFWLLFSVLAAVWGFGGLWIGISTTAESALLAWRTTFALGVIWMPPVFFHFVCAFCDISRPRLLIATYLTSFFFFLTSPTVLFQAGAQPIFDPLYFPIPGKLFPVFNIWWLSFILYCHKELWEAYVRTSDARKKNQILYFFLATGLGYLGGSLTYLPHYGIKLYPYSNFTVFLYPIIMSYAIIRYNLMDIRFFIRRTALLIGIYSGLVCLSVPFVMLWKPLTASGDLLRIFSIASVLSTGPFLYAYFIRKNSFFQENTLAGLTHELKSPLAIIDSAVDYLQSDSSHMDREQLSSYLDMIQRNSSRLTLYVNDLLHTFKGERQDYLLLKGPNDIVQLCRKVVDSYKSMASDRRIELQFVSTHQSWETACDRERIAQTLSNLISNAIKFSEGGKVDVILAKTEKTTNISVRDTGAGIIPEDLPRIFDRFYQGTKGQNHKKGTGIGLTIAKMWVEAHGGKIWAESEGEGKGATVTFTLPT